MNCDIRIGLGEDLHRLKEGRELILGGVKIPYELGLDGHSDADCVLHALTDALLGSVSLPDIGTLFPDDDPEYKGADSAELLRKAYTMVIGKGYRLSNADLVIIAQKPKLKEYVPMMKERIASILGTDLSDIGIKCKTQEGLGPIGEGLAIECLATVLVERGN